LFALPCASAKVQAFQNKTVAATGRRIKRARVIRKKSKRAQVIIRKRKKSPHLEIKLQIKIK